MPSPFISLRTLSTKRGLTLTKLKQDVTLGGTRHVAAAPAEQEEPEPMEPEENDFIRIGTDGQDTSQVQESLTAVK